MKPPPDEPSDELEVPPNDAGLTAQSSCHAAAEEVADDDSAE